MNLRAYPEGHSENIKAYRNVFTVIDPFRILDMWVQIGRSNFSALNVHRVSAILAPSGAADHGICRPNGAMEGRT